MDNIFEYVTSKLLMQYFVLLISWNCSMCKEALIIKVFILTLLIVNLKNLNTGFKFKYDLLIIINLKDLNTFNCTFINNIWTK